MAVEDTIDEKLVNQYEYEAEAAYKQRQSYNSRTAPVEEKSFLTGEPISWADITEDDNKKDWIWENYIARGNITLLSALWKAGKSTLLRCLFQTMAEEGEFAGQPTKKCKVLVISEEAKGEWSDKKEDLDPEEIRPIMIWPRPIRVKPNLKQWVQFIEEITQLCLKENIEMVVIDTLSTFWPIDNENDSAQVLKALVPMYSFTENNLAVLLIHHFRKGGGDQAQASRGSGALPGFVDNIIEFTRSKDGYFNRRELKTYGRFDSVIPEIVIALNADGKYETLGDPHEVSKSARINKIVEIVSTASEPLPAKDIHTLCVMAHVTITLRTVQNYLKQLIEKKILSQVELRLINKRQVPVYARIAPYENIPLPTIEAFRREGSTYENGSGLLSQGEPQNEAATYETKGIRGKRNNTFVDDQKEVKQTEFDPKI